MEKGLLYDRRWMLIDQHGVFMTQRLHPPMALFQVAIANGLVTVTKKGSVADRPSISFDVNAVAEGEPVFCRIWDDEVLVAEVDTRISNWFTTQLGLTCKLVAFPEQNQRSIDKRYSINNENVSLADAYPFMIIGQSSLDELNSRMDKPLPMNRFRPNFVFEGGEPFEEDTWRELSIGRNRFVGVKNCARCILPTIDQDTALKGAEPLLTLSTYRKRENKIFFGQNLIALDHAEVRVGDKIIVNNKRASAT
jgi:uncharacterized protein YcbX